MQRSAVCAFVLSALSSGIAAATDEHDPRHRDLVDEIVITANPLQRPSDELVQPVTVLDRDALLIHAGSTLGETLSREPGIATTGFTTGASRPVIRGQDAFRVRVQEDGVGTHDVSDVSPDHGVPVNPLLARRFEVVRGPATLRYGGGAIGGVVSSLTNRVPRFLPEAPIGGEVYTAYGTVARQEDLAAILEGAVGSVGWHLDAASRDSADYHIPGNAGRRQAGTDTDGYSVSGGGAYFGDGFRLGAAFARFQNDYGIPDDAEDVGIDLDQNRWSIEGDLEEPLPGVRRITLRGGISDYEHKEIVDGVPMAFFDNDQSEFRLELVHEPLGVFEGAIGVAYEDREYEGLGEALDFLLPTDTETIAAYLIEEVPLAGGMRLQFGGRIEGVEVRGTPAGGTRTSENFTPLSGSLGLLVPLTAETSLSLLGSVQQRAPSQVELFAQGPHEATGTFELGDNSFDEEESRTVELSLRHEGERVRLEAAGFYTDYDGYIYGQFTGRQCDDAGVCAFPPPAEELDELLYTQSNATFWGGELSGRVEVLEAFDGHLGLDFQADFVRARLDRGGNLPRITPHRYGAGVHFANARVSGRVGLLRTAKQTRTASNESSTSGHTMLDANLGLVLIETDPSKLEFMVVGSNLLNERARNHVSFLKDDLVLPGRGVRFALRGSF